MADTVARLGKDKGGFEINGDWIEKTISRWVDRSGLGRENLMDDYVLQEGDD